MAVNATSIKLRFPEFAQESDASIEFAIEEAGLHVDTATGTAWGTSANVALSYLAAHYLMVAIQRSASGSGQALSSDRIGEVTLNYATPTVQADPSDFTTTSYGSRYLGLCGSNFPAIAII